jgi:hypothetical protein
VNCPLRVLWLIHLITWHCDLSLLLDDLWSVSNYLSVYLQSKKLGGIIVFLHTLIWVPYIHIRYLSLFTMSKFKVSILVKVIAEMIKNMICQLTRRYLSASEIIILVWSAMRRGNISAFIVGGMSFLYTRGNERTRCSSDESY